MMKNEIKIKRAEESIKSNETKLMLLGMSGLAYTGAWQGVTEKIVEKEKLIKKLKRGKGIKRGGK